MCFEVAIKISAVFLSTMFTLFTYILMLCSALIYHYACLSNPNVLPKLEPLVKEPPWQRWGVTFGIRAYGFREWTKRFLKLFLKPSIKYFPKKSLVIFEGYSPKAISKNPLFPHSESIFFFVSVWLITLLSRREFKYRVGLGDI